MDAHLINEIRDRKFQWHNSEWIAKYSSKEEDKRSHSGFLLKPSHVLYDVNDVEMSPTKRKTLLME